MALRGLAQLTHTGPVARQATGPVFFIEGQPTSSHHLRAGGHVDRVPSAPGGILGRPQLVLQGLDRDDRIVAGLQPASGPERSSCQLMVGGAHRRRVHVLQVTGRDSAGRSAATWRRQRGDPALAGTAAPLVGSGGRGDRHARARCAVSADPTGLAAQLRVRQRARAATAEQQRATRQRRRGGRASPLAQPLIAAPTDNLHPRSSPRRSPCG